MQKGSQVNNFIINKFVIFAGNLGKTIIYKANRRKNDYNSTKHNQLFLFKMLT